jgi:spermidine synthase
MPYAIIPIGLSALLLYGFTFLLNRTGFINPSAHRQLWNTALLLTFFATAILGIILAIQVNYKLDMPVVDKLIVWHVNFGIGMSFIAVFHFSWHWSYYRKLITGRNNKQEAEPATGLENGIDDPENMAMEIPGKSFSVRDIPSGEKIPLLVLGATAMITQVIYLREYLAVFHGNELVIGIILAGWLVLTGLGARLGSNISSIHMTDRGLSTAFLLLGLMPILTTAGIRAFKNLVFPAGSITGIPGILLYSLAGMSLFCLLSGFLFTWLSYRISKTGKMNLLPYSYGLEALGSIAAGILFSFLLVNFLDTFQVLFLVLLVNLGTSLLIRRYDKSIRILLWSILTAVVLAVLVFPLKLDLRTRSMLFPGQKLEETHDTPYGNLVVSRSGEQYTLFENSSPIAVTADVASVEESVHYAMIQHPRPENILVLSGNLSGLVNELGKYHPAEVDFVELDPGITQLLDRYLPRSEVPWLELVHMDGRRFITRTETDYDVVLVNLPAPGSARMNRYYTSEFYELVKSKMGPEGVLSVPLPGTENYMSEEAGSLFAILYHTLQLHFDNILIVPGHKTFFIASDSDLDLDIPAAIETRGIATEYVNHFYLDTWSLRERSRQLLDAMPEEADINRDFRPVAFLQQISYWLSYFRSGIWITLGIFLLLILLMGLRAGGALKTGLFVTGFTGMGVEIALLLAIQVVFGYVYLYVAIVLTVFMMGLAAGSIFLPRILPGIKPRHFAMLQVVLAASVFLVYWWIILIEGRTLPEAVLHTVFLFLIFLVSFATGLLFGSAALLEKGSITGVTGRLYSVDLAGSAAGAVIMAIGMIPLLGLYGSLAALIGLNLLAAFYSLISRPKL